MSNEVHSSPAIRSKKTARLRAALIVLVLEKLVQHSVVSVALYFDVQGLQSAVAVDPRLLMAAGLIVAVLFGFALWGLVVDYGRAADLIIALALFDILGEFVAQGRADIAITVSFIVAIGLLSLALMYRRQARRPIPS